MVQELEHSGFSYPVRVLGLEQSFRFEITCQPSALIRVFIYYSTAISETDYAFVLSPLPADDRICTLKQVKKGLSKQNSSAGTALAVQWRETALPVVTLLSHCSGGSSFILLNASKTF